MRVWPLRFRNMPSGGVLFGDDSGGYFCADAEFLSRYVHGSLTSSDFDFLYRNGQTFENLNDLSFVGFAARWARRINLPKPLNFVILAPTLRCDMSCSYCQVSRAPETASAFDWSEQDTINALSWIDRTAGDNIKVEFQGGECLLRLDILERVRDFCRSRFHISEFVVCTNLQNVSEAAWSFLAPEDTFISTSFDGTPAHHEVTRTRSPKETERFLSNLRRATTSFGAGKVSALPTLDPDALPSPEDVIQSYTQYGLNSIFLRRINHQGFARKRFRFSEAPDRWLEYYRRFIAAVVRHNSKSEVPFEEFYIAHLIRRILRGEGNGHVNLRNPNWLAKDYAVIDYDGRIYPSDEARMITRVGQIDLSIGHIHSGLDEVKLNQLQANASNFQDPDCQHCVFQPYCGLDVFDDLSRYGRIDVPRPQTDHCRLHQGLFDIAFEMIYSKDQSTRETVRKWLGAASLPSDVAPSPL
ncbi:His-Xaa-Ser system radical SAM maturase HxsB [Rhodovulum sulfidophilum]|uniref:His-Xaa-Ser system radical SAM maturase HxsB n=1 Tax=Rhodovulum visakhapatnamense TaxID=364297 RepID=A0ABS1RLX4_9RHOB|nr:His-Xaa-Ser system radical SAM maturase HxsB [Rhodovulum visakhapatnamense]MBL3571245.1 His-Xaa-Ser system radical SAM maturase HxsB [Rhodovulum visakhapatnamense]MBL3580230.1 His-Xaa-Ser system radical SAM maturase HxsB [Rhodovulum visakhapatnamense]OLS46086.1 His-Xaa-Ser system radical SAM maturase HxsB [Rhodovulum sulfidophilum]